MGRSIIARVDSLWPEVSPLRQSRGQCPLWVHWRPGETSRRFSHVRNAPKAAASVKISPVAMYHERTHASQQIAKLIDPSSALARKVGGEYAERRALRGSSRRGNQ